MLIVAADLEWKLVYVGSAESEKHDQVLDIIEVGPVVRGQYKFIFEVSSILLDVFICCHGLARRASFPVATKTYSVFCGCFPESFSYFVGSLKIYCRHQSSRKCVTTFTSYQVQSVVL